MTPKFLSKLWSNQEFGPLYLNWKEHYVQLKKFENIVYIKNRK